MLAACFESIFSRTTMGDRSQGKFLSLLLSQLDTNRSMNPPGQALITGAALEGHSKSISDLLSQAGYQVSTTDLMPGAGVDLIWDLQSSPPSELLNRCTLVVSCSVLEHVPDPASAAHHLLQILQPGGVLYLAVPWVWRYHRYPNDYHRFHSSSLEQLLPGTKLLGQAWSTSPDCTLHPFQPDLDQQLSRTIEGVKYLPYLMLHEARRKL